MHSMREGIRIFCIKKPFLLYHPDTRESPFIHTLYKSMVQIQNDKSYTYNRGGNWNLGWVIHTCIAVPIFTSNPTSTPILTNAGEGFHGMWFHGQINFSHRKQETASSRAIGGACFRRKLPHLEPWSSKKSVNHLQFIWKNQLASLICFSAYSGLRECLWPDGLGRLLMLAVLKSLRNSERLIFPSLSMSASSRRGSIDPFSPVCWIAEK